MNERHRNTTLVAAIVCGLVSLYLPWLTHHIGPDQGPFAGLGAAFPSSTGLTGSITLVVAFPFWMFAVLGMSASGMQLLRISPHFDSTPVVESLLSVLATVGVVAVVFVEGKDTTPGLGWVFALLAALLPLSCTLSRLGPRNNPI